MYFLINNYDEILSEIKYINNKKEYKLVKLSNCFYKGSQLSRKYDNVISILPKRYLFKKDTNLINISVKDFKKKFSKEINIIESYRLG